MSATFHPLRRSRGVSFVSTVRPTPSQRRAAVVVALVSLVVFALVAPVAKVPLGQVKAFLPIYQSALVVFDLITCVLLFGQYRMLQSRALLFLAAGYVFSALLAIAHALSFPGLFAPSGAIGGGAQTTAWLYFIWHAGFPAFILAYAIAARNRSVSPSAPHARAVAWSVGLAALLAAAAVVLSTAFHDALPRIMSGNDDAPAKIVVAVLTWLVGIVALAVLWRRRSHTVLDLWLMVVLCVWIADTALAAVLNHARFDVGWYSGRIYGLLANAFVLAVLLLESGSLYARLAKSNRLLGHALVEMRRLNGDLEAFAGSLAHDLQQPLTTISSFAQVIQRSSLPEKDVAHLRRIVGATETAREMIQALLEFARLGESALQSQPVDLNDIVADARHAAVSGAPERDIQWHIGALPVVHGDPALLRLAFVNLISNAVKYTRTRSRAEIWIESERAGAGAYVIRIRDNGVGFDAAQAPRLFTPFERLHAAREFEGTGMGLANVRKIVERHGGRVSAQSAYGEGATFSVVLRNVGDTQGGPPRLQPRAASA